MDAHTLTYLYAIVPADAAEPPAELRGVEGTPVRLLRAGGVAAVVGEVPAERYGEDALDAHLSDLRWVGERGAAHEAVLLWLADRGPVLPLSLFSLHRDEARVRERLEGDAEGLREALERLRGRREWGVRLWRVDERVSEHLDRLSPRLRVLAEELETATPGRRFLLGRKRGAMLADELRAVGAEAARETYAALRPLAVEGALLPLPGATGEGRALVLNAAFLVDDAAYPAFQRGVTEAAHRWGEDGFELEFTGPWPPYHFAGQHGS
jgi:hypothetical protein